ncbi:MAG: tetratricopeptide repeat protein [Bacteroidota bacterium]
MTRFSIFFICFFLSLSGRTGYSFASHSIYGISVADSNEVKRLNELSVEKRNLGEYEEAEKISMKAVLMAEQCNYKRGKANALNGIGNIHYMRGNYEKALDYFMQAMDIREKIGDKKGVAMSYNNIALVYENNNDHQQAIDYYLKAIEINHEINNLQQLSSNYNNLGMTYKMIGELDKAIRFQEESIRIKLELNDSLGLAKSYNNMGNIYDVKEDFYLSLKYYFMSLDLRLRLNDRLGIAMAYTNIGNVYIHLGKVKEAEEVLMKSLQISLEIKEKPVLMNTYMALSDCDTLRGDFRSAFYYYRRAIAIKDSIFNENGQNKIEDMKARYESEKKELALQSVKKEKEQQDIINEKDRKRKSLILLIVSAGLVLVFAFAIVVFRSLKLTQKQKKIIEKQKAETELQKKLVDEKQKEIIDSINYARRIQYAILADEAEIKKVFSDSFLLYKPKDIVAGDFYFFENTGTHIFYAAADCTGHGVPGALVSVVCSNALTRCIKEFKLTDPGLILDKTRELVLETFRKSGKNVKDGMDISLVSLTLSVDNENKEQVSSLPHSAFTLQWSGANNPLWYVSKGKLLQLAPNKQPIGETDHSENFTTHIFPQEEAEAIYLFTDGYADQFGGPKGKKFKYSNLFGLLSTVAHLPMEEQKQKLISSFEEWKSDLEQVDDVCVIGVRIRSY